MQYTAFTVSSVSVLRTLKILKWFLKISKRVIASDWVI